MQVVKRLEKHERPSSRQQASSNPAFLLQLECDRSLYDITSEADKSLAVFGDWGPALALVRAGILQAWRGVLPAGLAAELLQDPTSMQHPMHPQQPQLPQRAPQLPSVMSHRNEPYHVQATHAAAVPRDGCADAQRGACKDGLSKQHACWPSHCSDRAANIDPASAALENNWSSISRQADAADAEPRHGHLKQGSRHTWPSALQASSDSPAWPWEGNHTGRKSVPARGGSNGSLARQAASPFANSSGHIAGCLHDPQHKGADRVKYTRQPTDCIEHQDPSLLAEMVSGDTDGKACPGRKRPPCRFSSRSAPGDMDLRPEPDDSFEDTAAGSRGVPKRVRFARSPGQSAEPWLPRGAFHDHSLSYSRAGHSFQPATGQMTKIAPMHVREYHTPDRGDLQLPEDPFEQQSKGQQYHEGFHRQDVHDTERTQEPWHQHSPSQLKHQILHSPALNNFEVMQLQFATREQHGVPRSSDQVSDQAQRCFAARVHEDPACSLSDTDEDLGHAELTPPPKRSQHVGGTITELPFPTCPSPTLSPSPDHSISPEAFQLFCHDIQDNHPSLFDVLGTRQQGEHVNTPHMTYNSKQDHGAYRNRMFQHDMREPGLPSFHLDAEGKLADAHKLQARQAFGAGSDHFHNGAELDYINDTSGWTAGASGQFPTRVQQRGDASRGPGREVTSSTSRGATLPPSLNDHLLPSVQLHQDVEARHVAAASEPISTPALHGLQRAAKTNTASMHASSELFTPAEDSSSEDEIGLLGEQLHMRQQPGRIKLDGRGPGSRSAQVRCSAEPPDDHRAALNRLAEVRHLCRACFIICPDLSSRASHDLNDPMH